MLIKIKAPEMILPDLKDGAIYMLRGLPFVVHAEWLIGSIEPVALPRWLVLGAIRHEDLAEKPTRGRKRKDNNG